MKHLDAEKITGDSEDLRAFIAGLAKIIKEEIGSPSDAFSVILANEMEPEDQNAGFGSLLAEELGVPFVRIVDAEHLN